MINVRTPCILFHASLGQLYPTEFSAPLKVKADILLLIPQLFCKLIAEFSAPLKLRADILLLIPQPFCKSIAERILELSHSTLICLFIKHRSHLIVRGVFLCSYDNNHTYPHPKTFCMTKHNCTGKRREIWVLINIRRYWPQVLFLSGVMYKYTSILQYIYMCVTPSQNKHQNTYHVHWLILQRTAITVANTIGKSQICQLSPSFNKYIFHTATPEEEHHLFFLQIHVRHQTYCETQYPQNQENLIYLALPNTNHKTRYKTKYR